MAIVFACNETTGFQGRSGGAERSGSPTMWRTANSRSCISNNGFHGNIYLREQLFSGRMRFFRRGGTWTAAGTHCTFYDEDNVAIFRFYKVGNGNWRFDEYNGTAWVTLVAGIPYRSRSVQPYEVSWNYTEEEGGTVTVYDAEAPFAVADCLAHKAVSRIHVSPIGGTGQTAHREGWSEIIVADNERSLVASKLESKPPNGNGTDLDGIGDYLDVDELTNDNGTTKIIFEADSERNSFVSPARTGDEYILSVGVAADMRYTEGEGTPTGARFYLKIGGVRYYSPTFELSLLYEGYEYSWNRNPATNQAWQRTAAQAATLEWGVEAVVVE